MDYLLDRFHNKTRVWSLKASDVQKSGKATSLSDSDKYLQICTLASEKDSYFAKFRSCREYKDILEHVSKPLGDIYLDFIKADSDIFESLEDLVHPEIGNPSVYSFGLKKRVSPTELRYAKILTDLKLVFGSLTNFKITEIGIGFGGQCGQIVQKYSPVSYELVDLPPVLSLAKRYLHAVVPDYFPKYNFNLNFTDNETDLLISNYAFSELERTTQEFYFNNLINKTTRGFVLYNHITPLDFGTMTAEKFASRIPGSDLYAEFPLTHPGNVLILWGHNKLAARSRFGDSI
jgi:putative sugar O-methyltransferase